MFTKKKMKRDIDNIHTNQEKNEKFSIDFVTYSYDMIKNIHTKKIG